MNWYSELYINGEIRGHKPSIADINANTFAMSTTGKIFVKNDLINGAERPFTDAIDAPGMENINKYNILGLTQENKL